MMKNEFEALAGYEVSYDDYTKIIEPMYMATDMNKADFVKCIDRKRFALPTRKQLQNEMKKLAKEIASVVEHNGAYDLKDQLEKKAKEYYKRFYCIDWSKDIKAYCFFNTEYTMKEIQRGCTYPVELVMGYGNTEFERITLIK